MWDCELDDEARSETSLANDREERRTIVGEIKNRREKWRQKRAGTVTAGVASGVGRFMSVRSLTNDVVT